MKKILLKSFFTMLFTVIAFATTYAQSLDLNAPIPEDTRIKKGVLANGMTYYIHKTDVTKGVASYYIIQNVGSILENDDQQGLAHFLEHMAFNGTENFEGKGILNTLQQVGAVFGKDINAYTSFDETVYNLDNIPTTDELVNTSLLILHDWSNYLLLTDEEIDAERGVIKEEWRTRQNGSMRIFKKSLPALYSNSMYADRLPIGSMDVVENFEYKALRDFYHDWYRTDLQAIAIVGDINIDEIEQKIINLFSDIPAVENPEERFVVEIEDNDEMLYSLAMDEEITTSNISFIIKHPKSLANETIADLKESLLNGMVTSMLSKRLAEEAQNPDSPYMAARLTYGSLVRLKNQFKLTVYPKPNQQHAAFQKALTIVNQAVKFGFTEGEISRTIAEYQNYYETQIAKLDDVSHQKIISSIKKNYLENETIGDLVEESKLINTLFSELQPEDIQNALKKLYTKQNRAIVVTGVQGNNNLTLDGASIIINDVENSESITAYEDSFSGQTLISGIEIKPGEIIAALNTTGIGAKTFKLGNGVNVHYKFVDKNKNEVKLTAISYGGNSALNDSLLPAARLVGNLVDFSGLGDFSRTDLPKVLAGKTASTKINISALTESISGSSSTKDVETMLQMVYLRFEKPRFDEDAYEVLMENVNNYKIRRSENLNEKMSDSTTISLYGANNPTKRIFNDAYINDLSFEKSKAVYLDRFKNIQDFEFFIVGDVKEEDLKPLLEKYIASIQPNGNLEDWKDNSTPWVNNQIDKDIYLKMEDPKSSVRIGYKNNMPYTLKNALTARTLGDILQLRFHETLREEEGGTYGAWARANLNKRPTEEANISVMFDCNPDKVDELTAIVHQEIQKIANGDIEKTDWFKTRTNYIKEREEAKNYNSYDMNLLFNFFREDYNMNNPDTFENILYQMTIQDIEKFAKEFLENVKTFEIVFKPE